MTIDHFDAGSIVCVEAVEALHTIAGDYEVTLASCNGGLGNSLVEANAACAVGKDILGAVARWQDGVREKANVERAKKKQAYCDGRMAMAPPIPPGFREWADKEGAGEDNFLFFRRSRGGQEVFCTLCGQRAEGDFQMQHSPGNPSAWSFERRAKNAVCPSCGKMLYAKAWRRQRELTTQGLVILAQPVPTGEILFRQFTVMKSFRRAVDDLLGRDEWEYELHLCENVRVFADRETFSSVESYREREVLHVGRRWSQSFESDSCGGRRPETDFWGAMYMQNDEEIAKASGMSVQLLRKICAKAGRRDSPQGWLRHAGRLRYVEYLYRSGLNKLADQIIGGRHSGRIDGEAKGLKTLLGLDGQQLRTMKELDGSIDMLENLHEMRERGEKADMETLIYMNRFSVRVDALPLARTGMSLQRMMNYLRRQCDREGRGFHDVLGEYKDYLDMAEKRGMDVHDEIVCRTPQMRERHDRYVEEAEWQKNADRDARVDRMFKNIRRDHDANDEHFRYARGGLVVIIPGKASDITAEGRAQHHCVGANDNYMKRMDGRISFILFLRRESNKDVPYYTLEVDYSGKVIQAYGAYDRKPDREEVDMFLAAFSREIGKRTKREQREADKNAHRSAPEGVLVEAG